MDCEGGWHDGQTPLVTAASNGTFNNFRRLLQLGADVNKGDENGNTALLECASGGQYLHMLFLLEHADANINCVNNAGNTVWDEMIHNMKIKNSYYLHNPLEHEEGHENYGISANLIALLRVMVLRDAPPAALVTLLPPEIYARVVQSGARLRARLPAYLVRRRALLDEHCPVLLLLLRALVHGYMELTTTEELWATELGAAP
jgi:hypothetical protein